MCGAVSRRPPPRRRRHRAPSPHLAAFERRLRRLTRRVQADVKLLDGSVRIEKCAEPKLMRGPGQGRGRVGGWWPHDGHQLFLGIAWLGLAPLGRPGIGSALGYAGRAPGARTPRNRRDPYDAEQRSLHEMRFLFRCCARNHYGRLRVRNGAFHRHASLAISRKPAAIATAPYTMPAAISPQKYQNKWLE